MPSPGGIADPEAPANFRIEHHGCLRGAAARQVFDQIEDEGAGEKDRQHLRLERASEFGTVADRLAIGGAELAGAVDRRGAHQIADSLHLLGIGLLAGGQTLDHVIEQADRAVGTGQAEFPGRDPPRLLFRHVPGKAFDVVRRGHAVEQREGAVPGFGDDPVRTLVRRQIMGEADQAVAALGAMRRIDRYAHAVCVDVEDGAIEGPALTLQAAQQDAHEGKPALVKGAEPGKAHDIGGRGAVLMPVVPVLLLPSNALPFLAGRAAP